MEVYDNLDALGVNYDKLKEENCQLVTHIGQLENDIERLCTEIKSMKAKQDDLTRNISELFNTAKCELQRKDRTIADLRKQLEEANARKEHHKPEIPPRGHQFHKGNRQMQQNENMSRNNRRRSRSPKLQQNRRRSRSPPHQQKRVSRSPTQQNRIPPGKRRRSNSPREQHWRPKSPKRHWKSSKSKSPPRIKSRSPQHGIRKQSYSNRDVEFIKQEIKEEPSFMKINPQKSTQFEQMDMEIKRDLLNFEKETVKKEVSNVKTECVSIKPDPIVTQVVTTINNTSVTNSSVVSKPVALRNRRKHCVVRMT